MISYFFAVLSILVTSFGQLSMKKAAIERSLVLYAVSAVLFLLATMFNVVALKEIPLKTFTILTALSIVSTAILSRLMFRESIGLITILGYCFLIAGVVLAVI